ncbi:MAG: hypothetical protein IPJ01_07660 [Micavibrio sp.]|nr:hypothetical protein [Micavibrio sp.]
MILSIIKDERFGISAHVRKQGRRSRDCALRQIQRASATISADQAEGWDVDAKGNLQATYRNTRLAIRRLGIVCEYDTFHNRLKVGGHLLQHYQGELSDHACAMLRQLILEKYGFDPKRIMSVTQRRCSVLKIMSTPFRNTWTLLYGTEFRG